MRASTRRVLWAALFAALLIVACAPVSGPLEIGREIPTFQLDQLDGGVMKSSELRGDEPVVINFWATWCGPCVREIPALQQMHREGAARIVSIALDREGEAVVRPFAEQYQIDYPVLLGDLQLFTRYGGSAIPYTLVLDGNLRVVKIFRGLVTHHSLERAVAKARG